VEKPSLGVRVEFLVFPLCEVSVGVRADVVIQTVFNFQSFVTSHSGARQGGGRDFTYILYTLSLCAFPPGAGSILCAHCRMRKSSR
jgi:hypothetical protein